MKLLSRIRLKRLTNRCNKQEGYRGRFCNACSKGFHRRGSVCTKCSHIWGLKVWQVGYSQLLRVKIPKRLNIATQELLSCEAYQDMPWTGNYANSILLHFLYWYVLCVSHPTTLLLSACLCATTGNYWANAATMAWYET